MRNKATCFKPGCPVLHRDGPRGIVTARLLVRGAWPVRVRASEYVEVEFEKPWGRLACCESALTCRGAFCNSGRGK